MQEKPAARVQPPPTKNQPPKNFFSSSHLLPFKFSKRLLQVTIGHYLTNACTRSTQLQWVKVTSSTPPPKMFLNRIISVGCRLPVALKRALSRNLITSKIVSPSSFLLRDTPLQKAENFGNCCSTFPHYVFTKASSNRLSEWVQNHNDNT